ncbi:unnamed protein product [Mortierella alpina]
MRTEHSPIACEYPHANYFSHAHASNYPVSESAGSEFLVEAPSSHILKSRVEDETATATIEDHIGKGVRWSPQLMALSQNMHLYSQPVFGPSRPSHTLAGETDDKPPASTSVEDAASALPCSSSVSTIARKDHTASDHQLTRADESADEDIPLPPRATAAVVSKSSQPERDAVVQDAFQQLQVALPLNLWHPSPHNQDQANAHSHRGLQRHHTTHRDRSSPPPLAAREHVLWTPRAPVGLASCNPSEIPCSAGHQVHPDVHPGHILGVKKPVHTKRHALYDTPFYGIENVEITSSRYDQMSRSETSETLDFGLEAQVGQCNSLRDHREHIWATAHEDEYGSQTDGKSDGRSDGESSWTVLLSRARQKRVQRWVPLSTAVRPTLDRGSGVGSGAGSSLSGSYDLAHGTESSSLSGFVDERDVAATRSIKPVSQGVYGPDSFVESLQTPEESDVRQPWRRRCALKARRQWRSWLILVMVLAIVITLAVILTQKRVLQQSPPLEGDVGENTDVGGETVEDHRGGMAATRTSVVTHTAPASSAASRRPSGSTTRSARPTVL